VQVGREKGKETKLLGGKGKKKRTRKKRKNRGCRDDEFKNPPGRMRETEMLLGSEVERGGRRLGDISGNDKPRDASNCEKKRAENCVAREGRGLTGIRRGGASARHYNRGPVQGGTAKVSTLAYQISPIYKNEKKEKNAPGEVNPVNIRDPKVRKKRT